MTLHFYRSNMFSENGATTQGATRLSEMQVYELLEKDAKLIIKEMDKVESKSSKPANWKLFEMTSLTHFIFFMK